MTKAPPSHKCQVPDCPLIRELRRYVYPHPTPGYPEGGQEFLLCKKWHLPAMQALARMSTQTKSYRVPFEVKRDEIGRRYMVWTGP